MLENSNKWKKVSVHLMVNSYALVNKCNYQRNQDKCVRGRWLIFATWYIKRKKGLDKIWAYLCYLQATVKVWLSFVFFQFIWIFHETFNLSEHLAYKTSLLTSQQRMWDTNEFSTFTPFIEKHFGPVVTRLTSLCLTLCAMN